MIKNKRKILDSMNSYKDVLKRINRPDLHFLKKGMQCFVFEETPEALVKVYDKHIGRQNLERLKLFYDTLDLSEVSFLVPTIIKIQEISNLIVVTEKKLKGRSLSTTDFQAMPSEKISRFLESYVALLFSIQLLRSNFLQKRSKVEPLDLSGQFFDHKHYSSWEELLIYNVRRKYNKHQNLFLKSINNCDNLVSRILNKIEALSIQNYRLIHGDLFPGNILVDSNYKISAVLDFGLVTTLGDPLFDIALGWRFIDMYHNIDHFPIHEFIEKKLQKRLNSTQVERLNLYLLIYCIISANLYHSSNLIKSNHFQWAINHLNDASVRSRF